MKTFTQYQTEAMAFRLKTADDIYALMNLAGEVGELLSREAKGRRDGYNIFEHRENVKKELGDILWMVAAIAEDNALDLEEVAIGNINKLTRRKAYNTIQGSGDDR
jgi:NTP pyrophosphatase (non-canonical NTP hydrolase)